MAQAESPRDVQAAAAKALPDLTQYTAEQALLGATARIDRRTTR